MSNIEKQPLSPLVDKGAEETLVTDDRDRLGPAEMVQQRLSEMQGELPPSVSQVNETFQGRRPLAAEGRVGNSD